MAKRITHITKEDACANVAQWALQHNWTLARCAEEMRINPNTLRVWLHEAGWKCTYRRVWVRKENPNG